MGALQPFWLQPPGDPLCTLAQARINQAEYDTPIEVRRQRLESGEEEVGRICRAGCSRRGSHGAKSSRDQNRGPFESVAEN